ncbi:phage antirepressor KilAC domain-containing protein [Desulfovibrio mangrovi]|uniref:phage antirepressor N-terminal domain-containing protein n=1 Tax=Desulfovibrio mangrovi TaxID=2976983 RepID=UPI00224753BA|nr:phage antirepressor N-terminal domain-containing protein [Desulfovibrio mangrovi]UZP66006.1 phage antirepressor KilAC domain-containing protein [Desulfovibrio mangrovi]
MAFAFGRIFHHQQQIQEQNKRKQAGHRVGLPVFIKEKNTMKNVHEISAIVPVRHEEVTIAGSTVLAAVTEEGKAYFSPRHVCDALGIAWASQRVKIMADPVLLEGVSIIDIPSTGGSQKTVMLPIEYASAWLFTIKKVSAGKQAKLNLYRTECFLALDAWFRQGLRSNPAVRSAVVTPDSLAKALELAAQKAREAERLKIQVEAVEARLAELAPKAEKYDSFLDAKGTFTLTDAALALGLSVFELSNALRRFGWLYAKDRYVRPRVYAVRNGYMKVIKRRLARGLVEPQGRITPAGLAALYDAFNCEIRLPSVKSEFGRKAA